VVLNAIDENKKPRKIMTMQASTLRNLEAANFSTSQALALGQAIDDEIGRSQTQFVTEPIFNAGLTDVRTEMKAEFAEVRAEMKAGFAEVRAQLSGLVSRDVLTAEIAKLETGMAKLETRMTNKVLVMWLSVMGILISMAFFKR
jgi:hypothetical protein